MTFSIVISIAVLAAVVLSASAGSEPEEGGLRNLGGYWSTRDNPWQEARISPARWNQDSDFFVPDFSGNATIIATNDGLMVSADLHIPGIVLGDKGGFHIHYGNRCRDEESVKGSAPPGAFKGHYYAPVIPGDTYDDSVQVDPWANIVWRATGPDTARLGYKSDESWTKGFVFVSIGTNTYEPQDSPVTGLQVPPDTAYNRVVIVHSGVDEAAGLKIGCGKMRSA